METLQTHEDIGRYLKDCRESMRVTIEQASRDLHIRVKYLTALEAGAMNDLPGAIYIRGYVLRYAQYLRLDETLFVNALDTISGKVRTEKFYVPVPTRKHNMPSSRVLGASLAIMLFLYAVWTVLQTERKSEAPQQVQDLPARYERLINPQPDPQPIATHAWSGCFDLMHAAFPMCQTPPKDTEDLTGKPLLSISTKPLAFPVTYVLEP